MKFRHKNSLETIFRFPHYIKYGGLYGHLVLTYDLKVIFISVNWNDEEVDIYDVTYDFDILQD